MYNTPVDELHSNDNPESNLIVPFKIEPLENDEEKIEEEKWNYETGRRVYDSQKIYPEKKEASNFLSSSIDFNENPNEGEDIYEIA